MEIIQLKLSVTNCYLIKTSFKYVLIDTGYEYEWELFCQKLKDFKVSLAEISHIILTHHHDDHCGLLNKIITENSKIQIVMSKRGQDLLLKGKNDRTHGGGIINKRVRLLLYLKQFYLSRLLKKTINKNSNLIFPPYKVRTTDILIIKETKLHDIGIDLNGKIIETPGHSIDSISIIFDDGNCIVGDAAANFLQFAGTKYCVVSICDLEEYYNSWKKIISENAQIIYPGHGNAFSVQKLKHYIGRNKIKNMVMYQ
jgi:glyoxylase-like metal-dependent hydrolase (beta-lactamase superfamily II)